MMIALMYGIGMARFFLCLATGNEKLNFKHYSVKEFK